MENQQVDNKFTWVIQNFSTQPSEIIPSDHFVIGGCKWRLFAYSKGLMKSDYLVLLLGVVDCMSLPSGWGRHVRYRITVVNQKNSEKSFKGNETQTWFDQNIQFSFIQAKLPLTKLNAKDGGFLENNEVKIVAEVEVLQVIGRLDVSEAAEKTQLLKKKINVDVDVDDNTVSSDLRMETSLVKESIDVNGFQVPPSQVNIVRRIFEKHPDIALDFRLKNPLLRTAYMNVLLSLISFLRKSPREISKDDMGDAYGSLGSMTDVGFKLDWLEKKLNQVLKKKEKEKACETRMQEIEQELKELKTKVLAARAPLTLDDVLF